MGTNWIVQRMSIAREEKQREKEKAELPEYFNI